MPDTFEKDKKIKGAYNMRIKTATLVPSTINVTDHITKKQFNKRIRETRKALEVFFGGYTEVSGVGGYIDDDYGRVSEKVAIVTSFSRVARFRKNKNRWIEWVKKKKKEWKQRSIGVEIEGDLMYI